MLVGLRLAVPDEPHATPDRPRPRLRRRLIGAAAAIGAFTVLTLATAAQTAFGAPLGDRVGVPVRVAEVGECDQPVLAFGLVKRCDLAAYSSTSPSTDWSGAPVVVSRTVPEPGDEVAQYEVSGWRAYVQVLPRDRTWRPVAEEARPDLTWLPAATMAAATLLAGTIARFAKRRSLPV